MVASFDTNQHFTAVSSVYREVRTTDREPVDRIAAALEGLPYLKGADIGCGDGRYDLLMLEGMPGLQLTCIDANRAMLEHAHDLLADNGFEAFETRQSTVESLELESGAYDLVSSFNAMHHFDFPSFLKKSRDGLTAGGHLFVYTRLPGQNERSIWGQHFPNFATKETRLLELGEIHQCVEETPGLRFVSATCLRYPRRASLDRLVEQARHRHYSTFALYDLEAFEEALATFHRNVRHKFNGVVGWYDENVLIHAVRDRG